MAWQSTVSWTGCSERGMKMFRFDFCNMATCSSRILIFILNCDYYLSCGSIGLRFLVLRKFFIFIIQFEHKIYFAQSKMIYEVQQTSSECPECSRLRQNDELSSSSKSSYEQNHRIVIPLKKQLARPTVRSTHDERIEETLNLLQEEVEKLKVENQVKQKKIKKLERELNNKELRFYPENARIGSIYENQLDRVRNTSKYKRLQTENYSQQIDHYEQEYKTRRPKQPQSKALIEIDEIERKIKQISDNKNDRIQFLEDQLIKAQEEIKELQEKFDEQISDNEWLTKFCLSFVNMAGQVSKLQGQSIVQPTASLRKNTKIAWKFFKAFIKQVIQ